VEESNSWYHDQLASFFRWLVFWIKGDKMCAPPVVFSLVSLLMALLMVGSVLAGDSLNIDYIGCLPGHLEDVAIEGNHAFCAARSGLLVLDISNLEMPAQVAFLPLSGAFAVTIDGSYAYLAGADPYLSLGGLHVVDISEPGSPVAAGYCDIPERAAAVVVGDGLAYVADSWNGLRIFDLGEPAVPVEIGFFPVAGPLRGLELVDGLVYLVDQYDGLRIVDVTDPSAPKQIGLYDPGHYVNDVAVAGLFAYVACLPGIKVVDISDPSSPHEAGSYASSQGVRHVTVEGSRAYLSHYSRMTVLDIGVPQAPVEIGSIDVFGRAGKVTLHGSTACLAGGFGGLRVIDVAQPSTMTEIGHYGLLGYVTSLTVEGGYLYLTGGDYYSGEKDDSDFWAYSGLFVIDVSEPPVPTLQGYCPYGNALDVEVSGGIGYVLDYYGYLGIFDLGDPSVPKELGSTFLTFRMTGLAVAGENACAVSEEEDLRIVDVSEPSLPTEVGSIGLGSNDVEISGHVAYVTHYFSGLHIVDISVPAKPAEVGNFHPPGWTEGLTVAGDLVYLANGEYGLRIVDVSEPSAPVEVGLHDTPGIAVDVVVQGHHAYIADSAGGVRVVDVSNPSFTKEIAYFVTPYETWSVAVTGDRIFAGTGDGGMFVLQSNIVTDVPGEGSIPPPVQKFSLGQNYPNPFNPRTTISFVVPGESRVRLNVYSMAGRRVATIIDQRLPAGPREIKWDGRDDLGRVLPAGVYFYRLVVGDHVLTRRMVLIR